MRTPTARLAALGLLVLAPACTAEPTTPPTAAPTSEAVLVGPLQAQGEPQPLASAPADQFLVSDAGQSGFLVLADSRSVLQVAGRPTVDLPGGTNSSRDSTAQLADDGSLTQLSFLPIDAEFVLHVIRVGPDGALSTVPVPDAGVDRFARDDVDAVAADGSSVLLVRTPPRDAPADQTGVLGLTRVDLSTATVTGRGQVDLGPGEADLLDVVLGPDGAPSVLVAPTGTGAGPLLLRFDAALQPVGQVDLAPGTDPETTDLDVMSDGTVLAVVQQDSPRAARVLAVPPGSTTADVVADLPGVVVDDLAAGPAGWAHLLVVDREAEPEVSVRPLDLSSGELAAPVELCSDSPPGALAVSPSRTTVAVTVDCGVVVLA